MSPLPNGRQRKPSVCRGRDPCLETTAAIEGEDWNRLGLPRTNPDDTDGGAKPGWDAYASRGLSSPAVSLPTVP
jgi:hypothetical protein